MRLNVQVASSLSSTEVLTVIWQKEEEYVIDQAAAGFLFRSTMQAQMIHPRLASLERALCMLMMIQ